MVACALRSAKRVCADQYADEASGAALWPKCHSKRLRDQRQAACGTCQPQRQLAPKLDGHFWPPTTDWSAVSGRISRMLTSGLIWKYGIEESSFKLINSVASLLWAWSAQFARRLANKHGSTRGTVAAGATRKSFALALGQPGRKWSADRFNCRRRRSASSLAQNEPAEASEPAFHRFLLAA